MHLPNGEVVKYKISRMTALISTGHRRIDNPVKHVR